MSRRSKSNVPAAALRWSVERVGIEFGLASATLRKSLAKSSATADQDGLFTTRRVVDALFGSLAAEKLATQKELRRKLELENAIKTASVLDRGALSRSFALIDDAISTRIMSSELSRAVKEDILKDLSSWPLALEKVAHRQTRLPRRGNGQTPDGDGCEAITRPSIGGSVP